MEEHKPLFEYLKYLEDYNHSKINSFIIMFINYNLGLSIFTDKMYEDPIKNKCPEIVQKLSRKFV